MDSKAPRMLGFACLVRQHIISGLVAAWGIASWLLIISLLTTSAHAQVGSARYSSIVVDASSGDVLEAVNADQPRRPASLTKLMTLYLTFEALRDRRITMDQAVPVSPHAAAMEPSKLGLLPGSRLTVEQAILGLVTKSANDAAAALAELLGGSEARFGQMMTLRARALGMTHSQFLNASGLPNSQQWSSARDMAVLARHLIHDFPGYYRYFATPSFAWHRRIIPNHDNMLRIYPGTDGMKTGYTEAAGHNLVTSAVRGGVRLVGVVLGAGSNGERDIHMASLLNHGFEQMDVPAFRKPLQIASRLSFFASAHAAEITRRAPTYRANWGVQVGTYATRRAARRAAVAARRQAEAGEINIGATRLRAKKLWRARVTGLSRTDAKDLCSGRRETACILLRPNERQVASR